MEAVLSFTKLQLYFSIIFKSKSEKINGKNNSGAKTLLKRNSKLKNINEKSYMGFLNLTLRWWWKQIDCLKIMMASQYFFWETCNFFWEHIFCNNYVILLKDIWKLFYHLLTHKCVLIQYFGRKLKNKWKK